MYALVPCRAKATCSNPDAIAWAKSFMALVDALQAYVKQWHTTGVSWNPKVSETPPFTTSSLLTFGQGSAAPSSMPPTNSAPATASGSSLPTPVDLLTASSSHPGMTGGGPVGLLADLNRGGSVTSGLRKVDSSQMTHKNPDLRTSSVVSDSARKEPSAVQPKAGVLAQPAKKTPRLELENGNKWIVVSSNATRSAFAATQFRISRRPVPLMELSASCRSTKKIIKRFPSTIHNCIKSFRSLGARTRSLRSLARSTLSPWVSARASTGYQRSLVYAFR